MPNSVQEDYEARSDRMDREHKKALGLFIETVNPSVRNQLKSLPPLDGGRCGDVGLTKDIADSPVASFTVDLAGEIDDLADELQEQYRFLSRREDALQMATMIEEKIRLAQESYNAWLLTRVIMRLTEAGNSKIVAVSLAFAAGVPEVWVNRQMCRTQIEAAKALAVSRQNLCKEVRKSADWLGIEEGIHLKKPEAVEAFRAAQKGDHWRKRKFKK